jgi:hypothetical protein
MLRAVEKLCDEATRNGNGNWDSGFVLLLKYLNPSGVEILEARSRDVRNFAARLRTRRCERSTTHRETG